MARTPRTTRITFHDWDGDACRVHQIPNGGVTADIYRTGRGHVVISAADVLWEGVQISESAYNRLVALNDEIHGDGKEK